MHSAAYDCSVSQRLNAYAASAPDEQARVALLEQVAQLFLQDSLQREVGADLDRAPNADDIDEWEWQQASRVLARL